MNWPVQVGAGGRGFLGGALILATVLLCNPLLAQPKSGVRTPTVIDPIQAGKEGRAFVDDLLAQRPEKGLTNTGTLKVRDVNDKETFAAVRFEVALTDSGWVSIFHAGQPQTTPKTQIGEPPSETLVVTRAPGQPNRYQYIRGNEKQELTGEKTMVPFARSDFWLADLGLEFLHWPKQLMLKKEVRHTQSCAVIESINPNPTQGSYARVVSWLDLDTGALIHADAYDSSNKRSKEFDPTGIKKIDGKYELEGIEMRNRKTDSHTWIDFDLSR